MAKVELDIRAQIANLNRGLDKTEKQLKDLQVQSTKTSKTIQGNMNKTNTAVTKLTSALGAMLTIGAAVQFTKAIINVRSEFEKYNAVLATSLGSAKAANREFEKIQKFASTTPFSVRELTDSFVRLVNQGFKPTAEEMRKLGDLAASTGKDFIQLTEAIIDAQVGEFERLKEFGIRASKQGDLVTFTFKEVETQVDFTADAIQEYILSLGELEGVTGSMVAISETLGGQLNNLADSWDNLLDTLGEKGSGVFSFVIQQLGSILTLLANYEELQQGITQNSKEFTEQFIESLEGLTAEEKITQATEEMSHFNELYMEMLDNVDLFNQVFTKDQIESFSALAVTYNAIREALSEYIAEQQELIDSRDDVEEQITSIESLQKKLKKLNEEKSGLNITDTERIAQINRETKAIKDQIDQLNKLGVAQQVKTPKVEELTVDEGDLIDLEKQLADESLKIQTDLDKAIVDSTKKRVEEELTAIQQAEAQKRALQTGTVEAVMSGLDLLAAANKDNAQIQQAVSIAQAIINGAVGITKTGAELGYPAAIPFQIALGLQTLAQIATIRSQKFERGGYDVLSGRRHAQGGINIGIGEAEDGEGVAVFSRQATQRYGKFLPAFVKAINENKADITENGSYNFNFDDSRSVNELKGIRKLLSKEEVSYEGSYKVITRNGQRTKVKI